MRFRVSGQQPVFGHKPGVVFTATLPPDQEARLLASGALEVEDGLSHHTRAQLDALAHELGVEDAESLSNKAEVIAAIEAKEGEPT